MNMNTEQEVQNALKRGRAILFSKNSECLQPLSILLSVSKHKSIVLWALDLAKETADLIADSQFSYTAKRAVDECSLWAQGKIKMPQARKAILACHGAAKKASDPVTAAYLHAIGQACSTVHTAKHGLGFPVYDLSACVFRFGSENCTERISERIAQYMDRLLFRHDHFDDFKEWADFIE